MTRKNWFELYSQFQQLVLSYTASFNDKEKPVWASYSQSKQPGRTGLELVTASFNDKEKLVWASYTVSTSSFNNQEEPVWASHSQFQWQWKTGLS